MKYCIECNNELNGNRTLYCSNKCKAKSHYKNSEKNTYYYQTIRGLQRKLKLIELKGGGCKSCGYNKNISALEFNHMCCKEFPLDIRNLANTKWEKIILEADKCELLCANCHREHHNPKSTKNKILETLIESSIKNDNIFEKKLLETSCKYCNNSFPKMTGKIYCSNKCRDSDKNYPHSTEIIEKYNELKSWEKVATHFNLTRRILQRIRTKSII